MDYWTNAILAAASAGLMAACGGTPDSQAPASALQSLTVAVKAEPSISDKVLLPRP